MKPTPPLENPWAIRRLLRIIGFLLLLTRTVFRCVPTVAVSASSVSRCTFQYSASNVCKRDQRRPFSIPIMAPTRKDRPLETDRLLVKVRDDTDDAVDDRSGASAPSASTGQRILDLAVPAAAALLIDPLMTLVDTAFVGRFTPVAADAAAPLAGMGSAAALLTFTLYLCNFLCTTTTPLVARQRAAGNIAEAVTLGGQVLSLALLLGSALTLLLWSFSQPLLHLMGTGNTGVAANHYATVFLTVRALAAPAVLCMEASTGILRGYLDTQTPIVVLVLANLVNLILDIVLVVLMGLGPMGAAMATTTAEWISALLFLSILAGKIPTVTQYRHQQQQAVSLIGSDAPPSIPSIVPVWAVPRWIEVQPLFIASSSALGRALVLQISLSAAAALAARNGAPAVAAHQIGLQLWLLCSFLCDALAAASQGLVADALGRRDAEEVVALAKTVFLYSLYLGLFLALLLQVGSWTHGLLDLFTEDADTRASLGRILPLIIAAQPLNALVFAADGVLQGAAEFPFQAKAMAVSGLTAGATFVALEAIQPSNVETLVHVWSALIALQVMRGLTSLWKLVDRDGPINLLSPLKDEVS